MPSIQRQTILSSVFIYAGFLVGALNMLLQPFVLDTHQVGLMKVINDFSIVAVATSTLGVGSVFSKFYPYYRHFLPDKENDLPFIVVFVTAIGLSVILSITWLCKPYIIILFGRNDQEIFNRFYWVVFPYIILYLLFSSTEPIFWALGKSVFYNIVKEVVFRVFTTAFLLLLFLRAVHFTGFMYLYAFLYTVPALLTGYYLISLRKVFWYPHISKVTRRMRPKMTVFAAFIFCTGLLTLVVRVCDTLFLAGQKSFAQAGLFVYALYFAQILDVPNRGITGGAVPVLVEYWRTKNMQGIASIYRKSAINLMVAGAALGGLIIINLPAVIRFFPDNFKIPIVPTIILIIAQFINLATGLNAQIIHTSSRWRFDFISTIIYSIVSLPLNFFFIKYMGIIGAAIASLVSSLFYNTYRWTFLYRQFSLQPFQKRNAELLIVAVVMTGGLFWLPQLPFFPQIKLLHLVLDVSFKSLLFTGIFGFIVIKRGYSEEVNSIAAKWTAKLLKR